MNAASPRSAASRRLGAPPPAPPIRVRAANAAPIRCDGDYVLYWMIAARRPTWNFALQHAAAHAGALGRALVILEPLLCDYPFASDRLHDFVLDGMAANARYFETRPVTYHPYVEASPGEGRGLLEGLGRRACLVVTDDHPGFFLPRLVDAAARRLACRLEAVDGNGLLPLRAGEKYHSAAYHFRRHLQKVLPAFLEEPPVPAPLHGSHLPPPTGPLPAPAERWPSALPLTAARRRSRTASLPIDHTVSGGYASGGITAARGRLSRFLAAPLERYADARNHPDVDGTSGLSPYLHFGHLSVHEIFHRVAEKEGWSPGDQSHEAKGRREGWWRVGAGAEAFLDQLVTWRELGFNACAYLPGHDRFESLPDWAQRTLGRHEQDPRPHLYGFDAFDQAATHDPLWNAAQRRLVREGRLHNYLRMLWGKKILEWSATPTEALDTMIRLNDRYALDGRDPNSLSGIFWCLGRYDRPWPERPVYGTVRSMSSAATARKVRVTKYIPRKRGRGRSSVEGGPHLLRQE